MIWVYNKVLINISTWNFLHLAFTKLPCTKLDDLKTLSPWLSSIFWKLFQCKLYRTQKAQPTLCTIQYKFYWGNSWFYVIFITFCKFSLICFFFCSFLFKKEIKCLYSKQFFNGFFLDSWFYIFNTSNFSLQKQSILPCTNYDVNGMFKFCLTI